MRRCSCWRLEKGRAVLSTEGRKPLKGLHVDLVAEELSVIILSSGTG
jgi:hypothetical protein